MKHKNYCRPQPLINVKSVPRSSKWYQKVLGGKSGHGGDEYEQIQSNGVTILQLHAWDIDHHRAGHMGKSSLKIRGNGSVLWFQVDHFDDALARIKKLKAKVLRQVQVNPNANHREIWLRDLDGYTVVVCGEYGDV